jgi:hypothetical protein
MESNLFDGQGEPLTVESRSDIEKLKRCITKNNNRIGLKKQKAIKVPFDLL